MSNNLQQNWIEQPEFAHIQKAVMFSSMIHFLGVPRESIKAHDTTQKHVQCVALL
jgi:hypothetical protein